jgi:hypothetical protein
VDRTSRSKEASIMDATKQAAAARRTVGRSQLEGKAKKR